MICVGRVWLRGVSCEEDKDKINACKNGSVIERIDLKQQIATAMVISNQLYDFELDDFGDYLTLTVNEEYKDKALGLLEPFGREVYIVW